MNRFVNNLCLVLLSAVISTLSVSAQPSAPEETARTSNLYLELASSLNYDSLRAIMADDAQFFDPTGDVFNGPVSQGVITGADRIVRIQRGWGLTGVEFTPAVSFYVGEYAVHRGTYKAQFQNAANWTEIPFVTIHHVKDGKIQERTDFGEYINSFSLGGAFDENTMWTEVVADQYLQAYFDGDLQVQRELSSEDIIFQDPTAQVFGPPSGQLFEGAEELMTRRAQIYEVISDFGFDVESSFYANHHAVYMGYAKYTISGSSYRQPAVFVVEVRDQKVTRHWDFVDYTVGPVQ